MAADVLGEVRRAKTTAHASMRAEVARLAVEDTADRLAALAQAQSDLAEAARAAEVTTREGPAPSVTVELAPVASG